MYKLWLLIHHVGLVMWLLAHGAQMWVLETIHRKEAEQDPPDRERILALAEGSGKIVPQMYVWLGVLLVGGVAAGIDGDWFSGWWLWASIGILIAEVGFMSAVAGPHMRQIREVTTPAADGSYEASDQELAALLAERGKSAQIALVGIVGLALLVFLMVYKPGS